MMLLRRSMMIPAVVPTGLPDNYLQVEYLESTGTQYIDVDDTEKEYEFEITALVSGTRASNAMFTGSENNIDTYGTAAFQLINYVSVRRRSGTSVLTNDAYISISDALNRKLTYVCKRAYGEIIDADTGTSLAKNTETITPLYNIPVWLFHGQSNADYATRYIKARIYGAKYYLNGNKAYDLVPCIRKSDSKPGMYDLVGRQFYVNAGTGEFLTGYVADGLVLKFDGINRGGETGKWKSVVGGLTATLTGTYTELTDGVEFINSSGASNYGLLDGTVRVSKDVGTIEHCTEIASFATTGRTVISMGNNYLGGSIAPTAGTANVGPVMRYYMSDSNAMDFWMFPDMNEALKLTASANSERAMCNGQNATQKTTVGSLTSGIGAYIGRKGNTSNPFSGKIHAIRIYNRKLSAAEMLHNQRVDNTRYSLGLTI